MNAIHEKTARVINGLAGKKLVVGVSGGRDSMCLLHLLISSERIDNGDITAVHINHRLRETADRDMNFVEQYCARNDIKFRTFCVDVKSESAKTRQTIEQAARSLRYDAFRSMLKSGEAEAILTAHHALDNAESVLMHLFRGAGLDGLCGMNDSADTHIVRPLLSVYPSELDEYAKDNGIEYVVDETNFTDDADRNFIRLNVLPLIEERYGGAVRAVNELAAECGAICEYLDGTLDRSLVKRERGAVTVELDALDTPLAARYVKYALEKLTLTDVTRLQIESAIALKTKAVGCTAEFSNGVKAIREYGRIAFYIPREKCAACVPVKIGANFIDGLAVDISECDIAAYKTQKGCAVDLDKLDGAVLRFRRDGDTFKPFGGSEKPLKRFFIDRKIEKRLRDRIPLVCKDSEVLVVVGVEISDRVKQTKTTKRGATVKLRW